MCWRRACFLPFVMLLLASCSSGVSEFRLYDQAFDAQAVEGNKVLDRLAKAERVVVKRSRTNNIRSFDPNDAAYIVAVGDPPLTAAIRASLEAVQAYNKSLVALTDGTASKAMSARIGIITANLSAAVSAFPGAKTAVAATGGGGAAIAAGLAAANRALPVFEQVAGTALQASFRKQLLAAYPDMRELIVSARDGTGDMYHVVYRSYVVPGSLDGSGGVPSSDLGKLQEDRRLFAGWVILLDQTIEAMDIAALAALEGSSTTDLAELAEESVRIRALAEAIKATR